MCKTEKETQMYRTVFWTLWEKARVGCFRRTASKQVYYLGWNRSPAQVGSMRQALVHREDLEGSGGEGGGRGDRDGNTCKSMADLFQCMTKPTTIKRKIPKKQNKKQRGPVGYSPWGHKESDMTEWISTHIQAFRGQTRSVWMEEWKGIFQVNTDLDDLNSEALKMRPWSSEHSWWTLRFTNRISHS